MIRHIIALTNGKIEIKDYDNVLDSQAGFCEEVQNPETKDVQIKIIREEK